MEIEFVEDQVRKGRFRGGQQRQYLNKVFSAKLKPKEV